MQGLLNSAGKGGGGGVGGDNANDGRFEMQIASRVYSGRDPCTFLLPLSLSLSATNCSHRLCKVAIFAQCVEVTATNKGQQQGGGGEAATASHTALWLVLLVLLVHVQEGEGDEVANSGLHKCKNPVEPTTF